MMMATTLPASPPPTPVDKAAEEALSHRCRSGASSRTSLRVKIRQANNAKRQPNDNVVVRPMLERHVRYHTEQTKIDDDPKLALDDCCGYCEKYREGAITPQRRMEIETWRHEVNHSNNNNNKQAAESMRKSVTIPIDFRYSPPGYPDGEPGFRRMKVTGDLKKDLHRLNLERSRQQDGFRTAGKSGKSVNFFRLTSDMASMSMDYDAERRQLTPNNVDDLPNTWRRGGDRAGGAMSPSSPRYKSAHGPRTGSSPSRRGVSQGNATQKRVYRNDSSKDSNYSTAEGTPQANDKNQYRTCSNDLLNVISIDDYRMRYKTHSKPEREDSQGSLMNGTQNRPGSRSRGQGHTDPSRSRRLTSATESGYDSQFQDMAYYDDYAANKTVHKAFDSILHGDDAATNSYAHRGLIKQESRSKDPSGKPKESKRFKKLNRALHDWIENEIVVPHQNPRGWYLSSSGSYHAIQSPSPTQGHSRSMLRSEGPGDQTSGAFLGMLMEIDENVDSNTKTVT